MAARRVVPVMLALLAVACAYADPSGSGSSGDPEPWGPEDGEADEADPAGGDDVSDAGETAPDPGSDSGDAFVDGFVAAHNQVRASVSPAANPALPGVQWSPELAAQAQRWAQRCVFEHSDTEAGENLSARSDMADPATIVDAWAAEAQHFDHRRNRCAGGEVCGHYTQVVWRATTRIGCAVAQCNDNSPFGGGAWVMWVCNYDPPGNYNGEAPY